MRYLSSIVVLLLSCSAFADSNVTIWNNTSKSIVVHYIDCSSDIPFTACSETLALSLPPQSIAPAFIVPDYAQGVATVTAVYDDYGHQLGSFAAGNCKGWLTQNPKYPQAYTLRIDLRPDNHATCTNSFGAS